MIKEKYMNTLAYFLAVVALVACIGIYLYNKFTPETLEVPEYVEKVFDKDSVMEINIEISDENFNNLIENAIEEQYVPANITINDTIIENVGIRAKGNSSLQQVASSDETDRFSFKVNFSEYITDQNLYGLEKMVLNNMIGDSTYLKEYMSYEMMDFMGVNSPAYAFSNIKINNEDWGLYLAIETLEEDYLERYYGKDYGNLYKPESDEMGADGRGGGRPQNMENRPQQMGEPPNMENRPQQMDEPPNIENGQQQMGELPTIESEQQQTGEPPNMENTQQIPERMEMVGGRSSSETALIYIDDNISSYSKIFDSVVTKGLTDVDKNNYIKMVKALNEGEHIEKYVDIEEVLRYFAVNTFLVNLDSYASSMKHNYYLYEENGVFQILPWDFNLSFGTFQMSSGERVINFPIDAPVTDTMENSPLIAKLLEIEEYKELYHSYLNEILENYINNGIFEETINTLNDLIYDYVANDKTAFYTIEEYEEGIKNLLIYGEDRAKSIYLQLIGEQPSEEYGDLETELNINALGGNERNGGNRNTNRDTNINNTDNNQNQDIINTNNTDNSNEINNTNNANNINDINNTNNTNNANNTFNTNKNIPTNNDNNINTNNRFMMKNNMGVQNKISYKTVLQIIVYFVVLILALIYVILYKRKKFKV